jgi:SnoaL-like domain
MNPWSPARAGFRGRSSCVPLTVVDRLDILELAARYNHAIDSGDGAAWAATFTPDGVFETTRGSTTGTAALSQFAANFAQRMAGSRHWNANHVIEGDGDEAVHRCYLQLMRTGADAGVISTGRYEDHLRRVDGAWRFTHRTVLSD